VRVALVLLLLAAAACALPGDWKPNYGLPYSEPTRWPYCVTEVGQHWISYPAQKQRRVDLVCGPKASSLANGLELLGAYAFDRGGANDGGSVRIVLSAQTLRSDLAGFEAARLADLLRNPARTATWLPWQESRDVAVASRSAAVVVRERSWQHVVVAAHDDADNVWVEDYLTPLGDGAVLVLRARYALDVPAVPAKLAKRRALTRSILEGIDLAELTHDSALR
jgi:hypothetical protein